MNKLVEVVAIDEVNKRVILSNGRVCLTAKPRATRCAEVWKGATRDAWILESMLWLSHLMDIFNLGDSRDIYGLMMSGIERDEKRN